MASHPFINVAVKAACKAAQIILAGLDRPDKLKILKKDEERIVTEIDYRSEACLIEAIQKHFPEHAIRSKDSGTLGDLARAQYVWLIDPLDGSFNFVRGIPHFCLSMAVLQKGRLEHGLVFNPITQECFTASRGQGARLNHHRLRVSQTTSLGLACVAGQDTTLLSALNQNLGVGVLRCMGTTALDLAYTAAGRFDGSWGTGLKDMTIAAGLLLISESGGLYGDYKGHEHLALSSGNFIAGNPKIFKELLQYASSLPA